MLNYIDFFAAKLTDKDSNMRSHIRFIICKIFEKNLHLKDEVVLGRNAILKANKEALITVGDKLVLKDNTCIQAVTGKIIIGDCVFFNRNCNLCCRELVEIGDMVMFGSNVAIWDHNHLFG